MTQNAPGERRFPILLILVGMVFPPGLLVYALYRLLRSAFAGRLTAENLAVDAFIVAVALFGCVAWAGALTAIFSG